MAFFDQFGNLTPDQTQGLLAAASQILQQSGPSRTPTSLGQILGGGLQAYQQSNIQSQQLKREREAAEQQAKLLGLKIQDAESDLSNQAAARKRAADLQAFYRMRGGSNPASAVPAGQTADLAPTVENAARLTASAPGGGGSSAGAFGLFQQRIGEAQALRAAGYGPEADAAETAALKFQPQVDSWKQVTENGRVLYKPYFKDGTSGDAVTSDVAEKLQEVNLGGTTQLVNPFTGMPVQSLTRTQSPDSAASVAATIRGQNLTNERAREANQVATSSKVANVSTTLRKEFDDLAEVKNYKQALPAYQAVVDAAKRNTPQADINLVYGIAKLYDPTSVVREGEYNTVANSPNIPDRIKGIIQYVSGGGKLTDKVKQQIVQEANGRIGSYEGEYSQARTNYSDIASRTGGDASLLFPSEFKPAAQKAGAGAKKISLADITETARKSGRTTAEVTAAARAKGYTIGD